MAELKKFIPPNIRKMGADIAGSAKSFRDMVWSLDDSIEDFVDKFERTETRNRGGRAGKVQPVTETWNPARSALGSVQIGAEFSDAADVRDAALSSKDLMSYLEQGDYGSAAKTLPWFLASTAAAALPLLSLGPADNVMRMAADAPSGGGLVPGKLPEEVRKLIPEGAAPIDPSVLAKGQPPKNLTGEEKGIWARTYGKAAKEYKKLLDAATQPQKFVPGDILDPATGRYSEALLAAKNAEFDNIPDTMSGDKWLEYLRSRASDRELLFSGLEKELAGKENVPRSHVVKFLETAPTPFTSRTGYVFRELHADVPGETFDEMVNPPTEYFPQDEYGSNVARLRRELIRSDADTINRYTNNSLLDMTDPDTGGLRSGGRLYRPLTEAEARSVPFDADSAGRAVWNRAYDRQDRYEMIKLLEQAAKNPDFDIASRPVASRRILEDILNGDEWRSYSNDYKTDTLRAFDSAVFNGDFDAAASPPPAGTVAAFNPDGSIVSIYRGDTMEDVRRRLIADRIEDVPYSDVLRFGAERGSPYADVIASTNRESMRPHHYLRRADDSTSYYSYGEPGQGDLTPDPEMAERAGIPAPPAYGETVLALGPPPGAQTVGNPRLTTGDLAPHPFSRIHETGVVGGTPLTEGAATTPTGEPFTSKTNQAHTRFYTGMPVRSKDGQDILPEGYDPDTMFPTWTAMENQSDLIQKRDTEMSEWKEALDNFLKRNPDKTPADFRAAPFKMLDPREVAEGHNSQAAYYAAQQAKDQAAADMYRLETEMYQARSGPNAATEVPALQTQYDAARQRLSDARRTKNELSNAVNREVIPSAFENPGDMAKLLLRENLTKAVRFTPPGKGLVMTIPGKMPSYYTSNLYKDPRGSSIISAAASKYGKPDAELAGNIAAGVFNHDPDLLDKAKKALASGDIAKFGTNPAAMMAEVKRLSAQSGLPLPKFSEIDMGIPKGKAYNVVSQDADRSGYAWEFSAEWVDWLRKNGFPYYMIPPLLASGSLYDMMDQEEQQPESPLFQYMDAQN